MEGEALVPVEPLTDLRMLVSGVVVKDDVDQLTGPDPCFDGVEESDELLMANRVVMPCRL